MGSAAGVQKTAARRVGLSVEEYELLRAAGLKRCIACREWKKDEQFEADASRGDGLSATCNACRRERARMTYRPVSAEERARMGPAPSSAREGDAIQARARINTQVRHGLRINPNDLYCALCGHKGDDKRHEYHHHMGYSKEHHNDVLPVCTTCHHGEHPRA